MFLAGTQNLQNPLLIANLAGPFIFCVSCILNSLIIKRPHNDMPFLLSDNYN